MKMDGPGFPGPFFLKGNMTKQFFAKPKEAKATLEIDGVIYKLYAPTISQYDEYDEARVKIKNDEKAMNKLMKSFMCKLGDIPENKIGEVDSLVFYDLFAYLQTPEKKT